MRRPRNVKAASFRPGSGNVFTDLRVSGAREEILKVELVRAICSLVAGKNLRQVDIAERLRISQPKVSLLLSGRTDGFSTELLIRLLNRLGQDIEIVVRPAPRGHLVGDTHVDCRTAMLVEHRAPAYRATGGKLNHRR
jgi:predicted XRE-type DNA-binding protein